jgi:hypothetical protein
VLGSDRVRLLLTSPQGISSAGPGVQSMPEICGLGGVRSVKEGSTSHRAGAERGGNDLAERLELFTRVG